MLATLIIASMVAGVFAGLTVLGFCLIFGETSEYINTYRLYLRNKSYGNDYAKSEYRLSVKPIFSAIGGTLFCAAITFIIIWASYSWTQEEVLCDLKNGTLNDSRQCVLEIPL